MLEIKDAVAVITGGGGGIGLEIAKYWVKNGGKVVIVDRINHMAAASLCQNSSWNNIIDVGQDAPYTAFHQPGMVF